MNPRLCWSRSLRVIRARSELSKRIRYLSMPASQERSNRENFVLLANSAVPRFALCTTRKTDETSWPAACCTVRGRSRSSFQVTPCPPREAVIRRPVTMPVWLGSVTVISRSVRALRVEAPWAIRRCSVGVPARPSWVIADDLSPSIETARTRVTGLPAAARAAARLDWPAFGSECAAPWARSARTSGSPAPAGPGWRRSRTPQAPVSRGQRTPCLWFVAWLRH